MISTGKTSRNGDVIKKPEAIIFYNKNKQRIGVSDQMTSYFTPKKNHQMVPQSGISTFIGYIYGKFINNL